MTGSRGGEDAQQGDTRLGEAALPAPTGSTGFACCPTIQEPFPEAQPQERLLCQVGGGHTQACWPGTQSTWLVVRLRFLIWEAVCLLCQPAGGNRWSRLLETHPAAGPLGPTPRLPNRRPLTKFSPGGQQCCAWGPGLQANGSRASLVPLQKCPAGDLRGHVFERGRCPCSLLPPAPDSLGPPF